MEGETKPFYLLFFSVVQFFGVSLSDLTERYGRHIPLAIDSAIDHLEKNGKKTTLRNFFLLNFFSSSSSKV